MCGYDATPLEARAHHLVCAVCRRGGCEQPSCGAEEADRILQAIQAYPYRKVRLTADLDLVRTHYFDIYGNRPGREPRPLPENFEARVADTPGRMKDLQVCRLLGIVPNTELPAYWLYGLLFKRLPALDGLCRSRHEPSEAWPECPCATSGAYESIAQEKRRDLKEQTELGESLEGSGIWALLKPRTRAAMKAAKQDSARYILEEAKTLCIRPNHVLCILCTCRIKEPLIQDNLIELRQRMEREPEIPVILTEGCCMVCDPCNVYDPETHVCYGTHMKNPLRGLMVLEALGLPAGAQLPARELYRRVYERIEDNRTICGWEDEKNTADFWAPCGDYRRNALEEARRIGLLVGEPVKYTGPKRKENAEDTA